MYFSQNVKTAVQKYRFDLKFFAQRLSIPITNVSICGDLKVQLIPRWQVLGMGEGTKTNEFSEKFQSLGIFPKIHPIW